jgi:hypothetical protein
MSAAEFVADTQAALPAVEQ